jgi:glutamate synthase domain-containing protein 3
MSGGIVSIRAPRAIAPESRASLSTCGNAAAYGATGGCLFVEGRAGQRVGVRNSGATIVVEGAGKYAFEYMTGGVGVVIGPVGPVLASGMTGGTIYVLADATLPQTLHEDATLSILDAGDAARLRSILEAHLAETGSPRAASLLVGDDAALATRFSKVVPAAAEHTAGRAQAAVSPLVLLSAGS